MTNQQNVVVVDVMKSGGVRNMLAPSSLAVAKSLSPQDIKMLLMRLETEKGGTKINAWVDSMEASSPTRIRSSAIDDKNENPWIDHHPSALNMFEKIVAASKGKQIVMFLNYDGTLSPIVEDPDQAFMTREGSYCWKKWHESMLNLLKPTTHEWANSTKLLMLVELC
ncbi:hypothetical protein COLO4_08431 [Corchorus olitorius]|uniref:Uncharacterized protein n=1 Tax=Corchorus olitorius TaxID=93759 RepID=A0A1R3KFU9_9ROSI|nr:hypothetical protein COLO4_08431 [Corchorus olitorius]